jgi:hypothetical protein
MSCLAPTLSVIGVRKYRLISLSNLGRIRGAQYGFKMVSELGNMKISPYYAIANTGYALMYFRPKE